MMMVLYAVKHGSQYLRDRKENGVELLDIDHASVYATKEAAADLYHRSKLTPCTLIKLTMTEAEIPW